MGWFDYHLHQFTIVNPSTWKKCEIGISDDDDFYMGNKELPCWKQKIPKWFTMNNRKAKYVYDFGDYWEHKMVEWLGGEYDPEHFDVEEISFDDPKEHFKYAFEEDV